MTKRLLNNNADKNCKRGRKVKTVILLLISFLLLSISVLALPDFLIKDLSIERPDNKFLSQKWYDAFIVDPGIKTSLKFNISNNGNETMDPVEVDLIITEIMNDLSQPIVYHEIINISQLNPNQEQEYVRDITSYLNNSGMYQILAGMSFSSILQEEDSNNNILTGIIGVKNQSVDVGLYPNILEAVKLSGGTGRGDNLTAEINIKLKKGGNVDVFAVAELWSNNAQFKKNITYFGILNQGDTRKAVINFPNLITSPEWISINLIPYTDDDYTDNSLFWSINDLFDKTVVKTWSQTSCNLDGNCNSGENFIDCPFDCVSSDDLDYCLQSQSFFKYLKEKEESEFSASYSKVINKLRIDSIDLANNKVEVTLNNKTVWIEKGKKQSLADGEDIMLVDLMQWNLFTKYSLLCADGVAKTIPGVTGIKVFTDIDLKLENVYDLDSQISGKLLEQKQRLNLSVFISNKGKADYKKVSGAKVVIKQIDFNGSEKIIINDNIPDINAKEDITLSYEVSKSLTGREREYSVQIIYDNDIDKDNNKINFPAFGFASRIAKCGDLMCDISLGEDYVNCAKDCLKSCGNNKCDLGEDKDKCSNDCSCGDNYCNPVVGENRKNCPQDCSKTAFCGDNICDFNFGEKVRICPVDCKSKIGQNCTYTSGCNGEKLVSCWNNLCQSDMAALIMKLMGKTAKLN